MNFVIRSFFALGLVCSASHGIASDIVGVDSLMSSPHKYKGKIKVEGAVTKLLPDKKLVVLVDRKEWEECGEEAESCAKYKLPVQYSGEFPSIKDEVVFEGEIKKPDGRFLFQATNILMKYPPRKETETKE